MDNDLAAKRQIRKRAGGEKTEPHRNSRGRTSYSPICRSPEQGPDPEEAGWDQGNLEDASPANTCPDHEQSSTAPTDERGTTGPRGNHSLDRGDLTMRASVSSTYG